ncbi:TIM44-like domain-containing protein [Vagococcus bubulae]|uniref:TIM44-like domain-containing protein n=1 Tax=Vagococcus bubulae TaxID=1977868 RepID=UPI0022E57C9A|nr:TIM44-like domain-containing protein [Vagococcus bubulae]
MKKRLLKILGCVLVCCIVAFICYHAFPVIVEARAGGGGSTGGSSGGSRSGRNSLFQFLLSLLLLPLFMLKNFLSSLKENTLYTDVDDLELWEYKSLFRNIQLAWTHGDMSEVKDQMDATLYEDFQQKLAEYKRLNKQNIVTNIQIDKVKVKRSTQNNTLKKVLFEGTLIDYFEENGVPPSGEVEAVSFKDIWMIKKVGEKMIVRDIQNL